MLKLANFLVANKIFLTIFIGLTFFLLPQVSIQAQFGFVSSTTGSATGTADESTSTTSLEADTASTSKVIGGIAFEKKMSLYLSKKQKKINC